MNIIIVLKKNNNNKDTSSLKLGLSRCGHFVFVFLSANSLSNLIERGSVTVVSKYLKVD